MGCFHSTVYKDTGQDSQAEKDANVKHLHSPLIKIDANLARYAPAP